MTQSDVRKASIRVAPGENPESWRAALGDPRWPERATTLKEEGENWVKRATLRVGGVDREVVIKRRAVSGLVEALKLRVGGSQFARHWRNARWLLAHGFTTGRPLVHLRSSLDEVLILEYLPGRTILDCLANGGLSVRQQHAVAVALGRQIERLTLLGRHNRDHKPSNLLLTSIVPEPRIAILDCVAIRRAHEAHSRMFASLVIEPMGTGVPPRRPIMARAVRAWVDAWEKELKQPELYRPPPARQRHGGARACWRSVQQLVAAHGDPTPRTNPLAPPPPPRPPGR